MPARHREAFVADQGQLVITIDTTERCLAIYPLETWLDIERQIDALPSFNKTANRIKRMLIGHAADLTLDSAGRVLVPSELRSHAELQKEVVLVGQGKKLELWSKDYWNQVRNEILDKILGDEEDEELPAAMETLSL